MIYTKYLLENYHVDGSNISMVRLSQIVRTTIEFVTVINENMIKIRYVDGTEVKEKI